MFDRVSWHKWFDGYCLNIEDPMYKKHPNLREGWYYGNKKTSYLKNIAEIIKEFTARWKINFNQVYFIGSSAAGYAALYLANEIKGSTAIAYNPQLILSNWGDKNHFKSVVEISLEENDIYNRNDLSTILNNKESKFITFINVNSRSDYNRQLLPFIEKNNLKVKYGLNIINNFYLCMLKPNYFSPHRTYFDQAETLLLLHLVETSHNNDIRISFNFFLEMIYQRFESLNKVKYTEIWSKILKINFGEKFSYPNVCSNKMLQIHINGFDKRIHYELHTNPEKLTFTIALHIEIASLSSSSQIKDVLLSISNIFDYKYDNKKWHNLYIENIPNKDIAKETKKFLNNTINILSKIIPIEYYNE